MVGTGTALAGCDLLDGRPAPDPTPDPLAPLLTGALDLADRYAAAAAAAPELAGRLDPIAEAHRAHAAELARVTGTTPSGRPGGSPTGPVTGTAAQLLADLRAAEQQGRDEAVRACTEAPAERAALLGSIAAARATHLEALR
ncbi:hypothetical protein GSF22_31435 [Micromonospora echinofusca]|uniref:DUF4439 domain-containing protein n=1 Tax=Micromonospora echinofusca TaxID=47858 RepID=A0ABS3W0Z9_MICEH|nr:hypothetical protein [Micromonospora echinofusca]